MKKPALFLLFLLVAARAVPAPIHVRLIDRLGAQVDGEPVPPLPDDRLLMLDLDSHLPGGGLVGKRSRGTVNFRAMAWAAEYVRVARGGEVPAWVPPRRAQAYRDFWRRKALDYFERERASGLMGVEQLCADPHHNFHVAAAASIRLGALEAGHPELVEASARYFRDLFAVYAAVATPDGSLCMSGARAKGTAFPCTEVGSMIYRTVLGMPQQGVAQREELWSQNYYAAARAVRLLVRRGDDLGGAAKMRPEDLAGVVLAHPMRVERWADRVRTMIPADPGPFYLRHQFASFTEVRFPPAWRNFRKLRAGGFLTFVKGWASPPPPAEGPPLLTVTSLGPAAPPPGRPGLTPPASRPAGAAGRAGDRRGCSRAGTGRSG